MMSCDQSQLILKLWKNFKKKDLNMIQINNRNGPICLGYLAVKTDLKC